VTLALDRAAEGEFVAHLADEAATLELGALLAGALRSGLKIYLSGELGAGKTTLVRGVLRGLGYGGRVRSPTFTLVELYTLSRLDLYHFDFYRFERAREWLDAGFREAFGSTAVCLVEWPEKAAGQLPRADMRIRLEHADAGRRVRLAADTDEGRQCLEQLIG
jgi:tRNA threonylcarbamoyladenosine biosynthesis protein TsaE